MNVYGCSHRGKVSVTFTVLPHSTFTVQILYKLYSVQLNCTDSNYRIPAATCSGVQQHSTFTVQILYSVQLNCTDSNYRIAAATCSAVQQHSTFTVQILYKLYSVQLNCTYSNYTEAAATCSSVQQHTNSSWCLLKCSAAGCFSLCLYQYIYVRSCQ